MNGLANYSKQDRKIKSSGSLIDSNSS